MDHYRRILKIMPLAGLAALLLGCASGGGYTALPPPRPLGVAYTQVAVRQEAIVSAAVPDALQLPDALALALRANPELAVFAYAVRVAEARVRQAGLLPNPELEVAVDGYDRDGAGLDSAEASVTLGQSFELAGKRRWRKRLAATEVELAGWDYEAKRLDVYAGTAQRFMLVLAAQERLAHARSGVELAEQLHRAVSQRVAAGKEPPHQASKSAAELELAHLDVNEAGHTLAIARRQLAAMWGAQQADFSVVGGAFSVVMQTIPPLEALYPQLAENPAMARWASELRSGQAALSAERAARIPDLQVSVGYLQYEEDGTDALAFRVGVPLPLFDRNQGNVEAARHGLAKIAAQGSATEIALSAELAEVHAQLVGAHQRVMALREKVVPAMEASFRAAHEGYQLGKFGFIDMLDAQRALNGAKISHLEALVSYHKAASDLERLTGTPLIEIEQPNEQEVK